MLYGAVRDEHCRLRAAYIHQRPLLAAQAGLPTRVFIQSTREKNSPGLSRLKAAGAQLLTCIVIDGCVTGLDLPDRLQHACARLADQSNDTPPWHLERHLPQNGRRTGLHREGHVVQNVHGRAGRVREADPGERERGGTLSAQFDRRCWFAQRIRR